MVKVKICGLRTAAEVEAAVAAGADAVGFVLSPGPHRVAVDDARQAASAVPPHVCRVGVFVDEPLSLMQELADLLRLDFLQLHGGEPPALVAACPRPVVKAFRLRREEELDGMREYAGLVRAFLVDAYHPALPGGSGRRADWGLARRAAALGVPLVLAGGLNPQNVGEAIRQVAPAAVDVSSGVEREGRKDPLLMQKFVEAVRESATMAGR